jgi:hypothetical protein
MSRRAQLLVCVCALALVVVVPGAVASPTNPAGDEAGFVARVNGERTGRGLGSLAVAGDLVTVARRHAAEMARRGRVAHYGNLATEVTGWSEAAETVGAGGSVDEVHRAFMASSVHRNNILHAAYRDIGVGVVWSGGRLWVSEIFRTPAGAAPAPAPAAAPAPVRTAPPRASRSGTRTAVPAAATRPAPPPPPPPAPAPPPPLPPTTAAPRPVDDVRSEERDVRPRPSDAPLALAATSRTPVDDADADVRTLLVLAGTTIVAAGLAFAVRRRVG